MAVYFCVDRCRCNLVIREKVSDFLFPDYCFLPQVFDFQAYSMHFFRQNTYHPMLQIKIFSYYFQFPVLFLIIRYSLPITPQCRCWLWLFLFFFNCFVLLNCHPPLCSPIAWPRDYTPAPIAWFCSYSRGTPSGLCQIAPAPATQAGSSPALYVMAVSFVCRFH